MGLAELQILNRRIASCERARTRASSKWAKKFWTKTIEKLLDNVPKH